MPVPHLVQYRFKIREGSPEGIRVTVICERDEFKSVVKGRGSENGDEVICALRRMR